MNKPMSSSKSRSASTPMAPNKITPRPARNNSISSSNSNHKLSKISAESDFPSARRASIDTSSKALDLRSSKSVDLNSPKKLLSRGVSELQEQLGQAQEELCKARDELALADESKARVQEELHVTKKMTEEAHVRLSEALVAQKRAEESSEIAKFRIDELEQANFEVALKKEDAWQLELESVKKQHVLDVEALLSVTQELQRLKQELACAKETKEEALSQAKNAKVHLGSLENDRLVAEVDRASASLEALNAQILDAKEKKDLEDSRSEAQNKEVMDSIECKKMKMESLRQELQSANEAGLRLIELEAVVGRLESELNGSRETESLAMGLAGENQKRVGTLEMDLERAKEAEARTFDSLVSQTKVLEETKMNLEEAKLEISFLREHVEALQASVEQIKRDLEVSHSCLEKSKLDTHAMTETVGVLEQELEVAKEDLAHALQRENMAIESVKGLSEEVAHLRNELKLAIEAEEKSKKAMDNLAFALHEVTAEANQVKEVLASTLSQLDGTKPEAEQMKVLMQSTQGGFQKSLEEARKEINQLKEETKRSKELEEEAITCWNEKETGLVACLRESEEEAAVTKRETQRLILLVREVEEEGKVAKEESLKLKESLEEAKSEADALKEDNEMVAMQNARLQDSLSAMERELQRLSREKDQLKAKEAARVSSTLSRPFEDCKNQRFPSQDEDSGDSSFEVDLEKGNQSPTEYPSEVLIKNGVEENPIMHYGKKKAVDFVELANTNGDLKLTNQLSSSNEGPDDGETINSDDFDHVEGPNMEDVDTERRSPPRQTKKKALLHRFGNLLRKKNSDR
ncbi:hypothetical protein AMTRI_Chr04g246460 [Amborella trichopoda]